MTDSPAAGTYAFDRATEITRVADGEWAATIHEGWEIGTHPHGGYLLALAGKAALAATGREHPIAVSGHFLRAPTPGPIRIATRLLRSGRSTAVASVDLFEVNPVGSGDRSGPFLTVLATTGSLATSGAPHHVRATPPHMPPADSCPSSIRDVPAKQVVGLRTKVEVRLDPATSGWAVGRPSGEAEMRGWVRMTDDRPPDPLSLLLAVDALPPTTFELGIFGWVPTVELTALIRGVPAPGWLRIVVRSQLIDGGWVDEEAQVWDSTDRLVAQARQLAAVRTPA